MKIDISEMLSKLERMEKYSRYLIDVASTLERIVYEDEEKIKSLVEDIEDSFDICLQTFEIKIDLISEIIEYTKGNQNEVIAINRKNRIDKLI